MATVTPTSSGQELASVRPIVPAIVAADIDAAAAILASMIAGYPSDASKFLGGGGSWSVPAGTASGQKLLWVGWAVQQTNVVWETANAAILVPFTLNTSQTIASVIVPTGGAQSGNFDVGVYDVAGSRKVSKGSTAQSTLTASAANSVSIGSTVLAAGEYYLALAADNITGSFAMAGSAAGATVFQRKIASSFPLPASLAIGAVHPTTAINLGAELT